MIESLFSTLGISKNEVQIYLELANLGKAPASILAKNLTLPRSTVYTCLETLEVRGLVTKKEVAEAALYTPNPIGSIETMVKNEKKKSQQSMQKKETAAAELIPLLQFQFKNKNFSLPKLEFFEGKSGIESMLNKYEKIWQESISNYDNTWWGYQDPHFVENYRIWLDRYWANMKVGEKICLLSNISKTEKELEKNVKGREIKTIGEENNFSSTIWALGDYVITIMTRQQPHYAFFLHDAVFAANQRMVFQMLWKKS